MVTNCDIPDKPPEQRSEQKGERRCRRPQPWSLQKSSGIPERYCSEPEREDQYQKGQRKIFMVTKAQSDEYKKQKSLGRAQACKELKKRHVPSITRDGSKSY